MKYQPTEATANKMLDEMMESAIGRMPPNSELLADPAVALQLQIYMFPFVLERLNSLKNRLVENRDPNLSDKERTRLNDSVMKQTIITCLFLGLTMETSSLVLAEMMQ